jgi:hypothetical protein
MPSSRRQLLLAALLCALACLAWPGVAWASYSQCSEPLELVSMEPAAPERAPTCELDLLIVGDAVPICSSEGATAVAPRVIHAVSDARIEAAELANLRCSSTSLALDVSLPSDDSPHQSPSTAPHALLPALEPIAPVDEALTEPLDPNATAAPSGVRSDGFRPPRG